MSKSRSKLQTTPRKKTLLVTVLVVGILVSLGAIGYGGWQLWLRHQATNNPNVTINTETVTVSTETPDETVPTQACADYSVAALEPERLSIPSLGVEGCIQNVGIDQHGAVAVPTNIHIGGWFVDSARPGEPGLSIIDGHINGNFTNDGIFQHLDQLRKGEMFTVTRGDGTILQFETVSVKSIAVGEAADELFKHDTAIDSQLNLITCGGQWNEEMKQFDHRIIATAKRIQ